MAPAAEVDRIMSALGSRRSGQVDAFMAASLHASTPLDFANRGGSYVQRNARETTQKWRSRMQPHEVARIMQLVGETAERFGYLEADL